MNEKEIEKLLSDVYDGIRLTEFNDETTAKRLEEYIAKNGELDSESIIDFSREEANQYSRMFLFGTLRELARQGYLNKK